MHERPFSSTIVVGAVAAAATTGALVAMGRRLGSVQLLFASIGAIVFQRSSVGVAPRVVVAGLLLHLFGIFVWSALYVRIAGVVSRRSLLAVLVATTHCIVSWIVAWWSSTGLASALALGDRIVFAVIFASALVVGMRFAFSNSRGERPSAHPI